MQMNPLKKEWEQMGIALLTDEEAKTLNDSAVHTGVKYEQISKPKKKTVKQE